MVTTNTSIKIVEKDTYLASTPYGLRVKVKNHKELEVMIKEIFNKGLVVFICEIIGSTANLVVDHKTKDIILPETIKLLVDDKPVVAELTDSGYNFDKPIFTVDVLEEDNFIGIISRIIN